MADMKTYRDFGIEIPYGRMRGQIKTFCPECRDRRTDKRDKSLSVDLDNGVWHCHYCGWSQGLPKEKDMSWNNNTPYKPQKPTYKRPKLSGQAQISDKAKSWFKSREISEGTLVKMKITEGKEFMPQKGKEVNTIQFNYYRDGELVNTKFRTGDKCFKLVSGAELIPYNIDAIKDTKTCVITEGECFRGDAEILTSNGFVRFDKYKGEDVAVVNENLSITFKQPLARVKKRYDGELIEFKNKYYYSLTTPGHNMFFRSVRNGTQFKKTADELYLNKSAYYQIPTAAKTTNSEGLDISDDMLRFCIAVSADFTIRPWGALYAALKKERKIERLKMLIKSLNLKCSITRDCRGYASFYIRQNEAPQGMFKLFPKEWIGKLSARQCRLILEEIVHWDGNNVKGKNQIEYSTKEYHNASFIQAIAYMSGYNSTIIKRQNEYGSWYKVSVLFGKDHVATQSLRRQKIHHEGYVYCVQVDTGLIMVRQNGIVSITGNCDALSFVECGYDAVVSVPNGANANLTYLDDFIESHFENKDCIYIASDSDTKGVMLRDELIRRFGVEKCRIVTYGEGCKDANEHLIKFGKESLLQCIENATEPRVEGIFTVDDIDDAINALYDNGFQKGVTVGHDNLDRLISFETKRLCIITGSPGSGKSEFIDELAERLNIKYEWRFAFFSPENAPLSFHFGKLAEKFTGKKFNKQTLPYGEFQQVKEHLKKNFFFISPEQDFTLDSILQKAQVLVRRKGIKALVIDPYNRVESTLEKGQTETQAVSKFLDKLTNFAQRNDVLVILMAHPTKLPKGKDGGIEVPTLYDISGSANFFNKADFGIVVHRDRINNVTEIHVQKVKFRHLGECGKADFKYNLNNGRYVPYNGETYITWDNENHLVQKLTQQLDEASKVSIFDDFPSDFE